MTAFAAAAVIVAAGFFLGVLIGIGATTEALRLRARRTDSERHDMRRERIELVALRGEIDRRRHQVEGPG